MNKNIVAAIALVAGGILSVLNSTILTPILPVIMSEMDVSATTVQWLASLFMLVNAVVVPMTAFVMGRFNTRTLFAASMVSLAIGSIICMWSPHFGVLLAGRAIQAIAAGILMPLIVTVLMLLFPPEKRGSVMGVYMLSVSAAPAIGPVLIGALSDTTGWRPVFAVIAALAVILLLAGNVFIQKTVAGKASTLDAPSVILSSVPLLCLLYGFSSISSGDHILVIGCVIIGFVGLGFFAKRQLGMDVPYLDIRVLCVKRFTIGTIMGALANAVLTVLTVTLPLFLQNVCGATPTVSGLAVAPIAAGAAIISVVAGKLHDTLGARKTATAGALIMTAAAIGMLFLGEGSPVALTSIFATLVGVGAMATSVPMSTWSINALPNDLISHGNAVGSTLRQAASSLCTALAVTTMAAATAIFQSAGNEQAIMAGAIAAFAFNMILAAAALVISLLLVRS